MNFDSVAGFLPYLAGLALLFVVAVALLAAAWLRDDRPASSGAVVVVSLSALCVGGVSILMWGF